MDQRIGYALIESLDLCRIDLLANVMNYRFADIVQALALVCCIKVARTAQ